MRLEGILTELYASSYPYIRHTIFTELLVNCVWHTEPGANVRKIISNEQYAVQWLNCRRALN